MKLLSIVSSLSFCLCLFLCQLQFLPAAAENANSATAAAGASGKPAYENWQDHRRNREVPVKFYFPKSGKAPYPVVIFSHGLGGSREAATYLGDYWSQHGYFCIFLQHAGSDSSVWQSQVMAGRQLIFQRLKSAANAQNLFDRVDDVKFAIDILEQLNQSDPALKGQLNLKEIAVAGHSFGALTSLVIAGQREGDKSFEDKRVKAAIYLCPPVKTGKSSPEEAYGSIALPGLLLTGTKDVSPIGETTAAERRIPFDSIKAPHQYIANFDGADHSVFGGRGFRPPLEADAATQKMIQELSTKFLDATLKNDSRAWHWLDSKEATDYLGRAAVYERR